MDIEYELNNLIFKYDIDQPFPQYRSYVKAREILRNLYDTCKDKYAHIVLISDNDTDLEWVQACICSEKEKQINWGKDKIIPFEDKSIYINISFSYREEIKENCELLQLEVIDIYDVFATYQLNFKGAFYDIFIMEYFAYWKSDTKRDWSYFDINWLFFNERNRYEACELLTEKERYLRRLIFICVYAKDFITLKQYILLMQGDEQEKYLSFYRELETLLQKIKSNLVQCTNNVLITWLDALEYGEDKDMKFFKSIDESSITFSNAYTVTPYTGATFKTLFAKKRAIEEEGFRINLVSEENSKLFKELKNLDYKFKHYGGIPFVEQHQRGMHYYNRYATVITKLYWDIVRDMLLHNERKGLYLLHEGVQTHAPFISLGISGEEYYNNGLKPGQQQREIQLQIWAEESRAYVDKQLEFWANMLPESMTKIYMSDHGHTLFGRFHAILKVQSVKYEPCCVNELFSYYDFSELLMDILQGNKMSDSYFSNDYVIIQDVPYYNKAYLRQLIEAKELDPDTFFGYQGVITREDMLIKYHHGVTYYLKHQNDNTMVTDDRIRYLQGLLSNKEIDVWSEPKFEGSRWIYQVWENSSIRCEEEEDEKRKAILNIFSQIESESMVAIRGGGMATLRLLMMLPYHLRKKIRYIIDTNKDCLAARMGIQTITPYEIEKYGIGTVVLPSLKYRKMWRNELENKVEIIDLYDIFHGMGINYKDEFFKRQYSEDDFRLGL